MVASTKPSANGNRLTKLANPTNAAEADIDLGRPYTVRVTIRGVADLLFHRYGVEAVAEKAAAKKGSAAKKTDNVESYVYRNDSNQICLPGRYLVASITNKQNGAAKYRQDPRSPRKSALDLFRAAVIPMTALAPVLVLGEPVETWEYEDAQGVSVNNARVTRVRPAFRAGWEATIDLMVALPQYIGRDLLHDVLVDAGRLVGVGDFRPTYGRFSVVRFEDAIEAD